MSVPLERAQKGDGRGTPRRRGTKLSHWSGYALLAPLPAHRKRMMERRSKLKARARPETKETRRERFLRQASASFDRFSHGRKKNRASTKTSDSVALARRVAAHTKATPISRDPAITASTCRGRPTASPSRRRGARCVCADASGASARMGAGPIKGRPLNDGRWRSSVAAAYPAPLPVKASPVGRDRSSASMGERGSRSELY